MHFLITFFLKSANQDTHGGDGKGRGNGNGNKDSEKGNGKTDINGNGNMIFNSFQNGNNKNYRRSNHQSKSPTMIFTSFQSKTPSRLIAATEDAVGSKGSGNEH